MRHSFITFRSHPNEKYLDTEFLTLITPMLNKSIKYVVSYENENSIDSHYHIMMFHEANKFDISNLRSKFQTKAWKNWFENIKPLHTIIGPTFDDCALQLRLVGPTDEDYLKTLGYICKENVYRSKEFDEQEITDAVKYYHISSRKPQKVENTWKILTTKNAHAIIEDFCKKNDLKITDKYLFLNMKEKKYSFCQITEKQRDIIQDELVVANPQIADKFSLTYAAKNILEGSPNDYYREIYQKLIIDLANSKNMNEMRGYINTQCLHEGLEQYQKE